MRDEDLHKFAGLISDKLEALTKTLGEHQELTTYIQRELATEASALRAQMQKDFDAGVAAHRQHITELYAKFERIVYVALLLISAVVVFLGYSEWRRVPTELSAQIKAIVDAHKSEIEKHEAPQATAIETLTRKVKDATTTIDTSINDFQSGLKQKTSDYSAQLNNFRTDTLLKFASDVKEMKRATYLAMENKSDAALTFLMDNWDSASSEQDQLQILSSFEQRQIADDSALYKKVSIVLSNLKPYTQITNSELRRIKVKLGLLFSNDSIQRELRDILHATDGQENKSRLRELLSLLDSITPSLASLGSRESMIGVLAPNCLALRIFVPTRST